MKLKYWPERCLWHPWQFDPTLIYYVSNPNYLADDGPGYLTSILRKVSVPSSTIYLSWKNKYPIWIPMMLLAMASAACSATVHLIGIISCSFFSVTTMFLEMSRTYLTHAFSNMTPKELSLHNFSFTTKKHVRGFILETISFGFPPSLTVFGGDLDCDLNDMCWKWIMTRTDTIHANSSWTTYITKYPSNSMALGHMTKFKWQWVGGFG